MTTKIIKGAKIFPGKEKGPTTLVVGLMHGNEIVGKHVIDDIEKKAKKRQHPGTLITLIANIDAYKKHTRFIDSDLNRSFTNEIKANDHESKRAHEIMEFLQGKKIDYIFDIHSTPSKSDAMILCTKQKASLELAKKFPITYIIKGLIDKVDGVPLVNYLVKIGTTGIAFEAGCHKEKKTINTGKKIGKIIRNIHNGHPIQNIQGQKTISTNEVIYTSDPTFTFTKKYKGFETISAGEVRGKDSMRSYSFQKDKILIMPNTKFKDDLKKKQKTWLVYFGEKK